MSEPTYHTHKEEEQFPKAELVWAKGKLWFYLDLPGHDHTKVFTDEDIQAIAAIVNAAIANDTGRRRSFILYPQPSRIPLEREDRAECAIAAL